MTGAELIIAAEMLFVSDLQPSGEPTVEQIEQAVTAAALRHGADGAAGFLAQESGDHPEQAARRMCWCRAAVREAFSPAAVS